MAKCLVTTLQESVNDSSLLKIDEISIEVRTKSTDTPRYIGFAGKQGVTTLTLTNGEYFTDLTGVQNYGTTLSEGPRSSKRSIYFTNKGNCRLIISNKSNIKEMVVTGYSFIIEDIDLMGLTSMEELTAIIDKNLDYIKYMPNLKELYDYGGRCEGNLNIFQDFPLMETIRIGTTTTNMTGNIASLSGCTNLHILLLRSPSIKGDISSISNLPLTNLNLKNTSVSGNLSSLAQTTTLTSLELDGTNITGDTSSLAGLTNLTTFTYTNTAITGTWPLV